MDSNFASVVTLFPICRVTTLSPFHLAHTMSLSFSLSILYMNSSSPLHRYTN